MKYQTKSTDNELQLKHCEARVEVKEAAEGANTTFKAYVLAFGNVDSWGDIIMPNACDEWIRSESADRMALCWQHDLHEVIGKITAKGVDDYGMWIEAEILPTTKGKDAAILIKGGAIKEFSIGYIADKYHYERREGYTEDIRILDAISIWEASPVTRAANPSAVLTSVKNDNNINPSKQETTMTPEEIKAIEAEAAAKIEAVRAQLAEKAATIEEQTKSIDNLDKSLQDQAKAIEELKAQLTAKSAPKNMKEALRQVLVENKERIDTFLKKAENGQRLSLDVKLASTDISNNTVFGAVTEDAVSSAPNLPLAFLGNFPTENVNGTSVAWLEGAYTTGADYVAELTAAQDASVTMAEKHRQFGKIADHVRLSSEVSDFYSQVYNWVLNEAVAKIEKKVDSEIINGVGADSTAANKIYGIKTYSTAFSGLGTYASANLADVIKDATLQAQKAGFTSNVAIVAYDALPVIQGLKDANGNYLYNQITGYLGQVRIVPSAALTAKQVLVADTSCAVIKKRPVYELEIERNASLDGWDVYVRRGYQVLTTTAQQKGLIWVADYSTAITAITK